ncbi:MAG: ABC transporter ATP-binding protein [bacterium]|nr:ABC transporter ATP-binding protein [bacterium]
MLRFENVKKSFGKTVAVAGLSLEVNQGEIFGLLGPNGAGKTTSVNLAIGLLQPDVGTIEIVGAGAPTAPLVRSRIGIAPQALALYEDLSGQENLAFFGQLQGLSGAHLKDRVKWALDFVQLYDRRKDRVKAYSGGMKRRLNLAAALIHNPPLLLLDEPTAGVDPQSRNAIYENILNLRKEGHTIVYTTHYMEEAQRLCDRVGIIDQGKMLALDTVSNLIEQFGGKDLAIAETAEGEIRIETENPVAELEKLRQSDRLIRFRVDRPSLESVFLNLTGRKLRD